MTSSYMSTLLLLTHALVGVVEAFSTMDFFNFIHIPPTLSLTNSGLSTAECNIVGDRVRGALQLIKLSCPVCEEVERLITPSKVTHIKYRTISKEVALQ